VLASPTISTNLVKEQELQYDNRRSRTVGRAEEQWKIVDSKNRGMRKQKSCGTTMVIGIFIPHYFLRLCC